MQSLSVDSTLRQLAITSIAGYQKYLSPHKGFSCAHRVLHGGESCSQYIKRTIAEVGLWTAWQPARERFAACKEANQILKSRCLLLTRSESDSESDSETGDRNSDKTARRQPAACRDGCGEVLSGLGDVADAGIDCTCGFPNCASGVDCSACDCAGLDCGGLDCNFLDCGSCS